MKNPLLIPFFAILLTIFVVGFISKQEQSTDEKLFREYLQGFKQAKLPLEVTAKLSTFNPQKTIPKKFDKFLLERMKPFLMSRIPSNFQNEYICKMAENDSIVVLLCGSMYVPTDIANKKHVGYSKILIVYDKNGVVLDYQTLAYEQELDASTTNISNDSTFYVKTFTKKGKRKSEWKLDKTENFVITPAGKIEQKP